MISTIVTDIEGTTSSISFVHEVLFPYAASHLENYVLQNKDDTSVKSQLAEVASIARLEPSDTPAIIKQLAQWINEDRKVTPLKALQGMIWKTGYESGDFQGHIYEDAYQALVSWNKRAINLYVYSSGSIAAQKLLFGHTAYGDLNYCFKGNFDTRIGGKKEAASYQKILSEINQPGQEVLFLSDIIEELDAALAAGMRTCCLVRDAQQSPGSGHPVVSNFSEIDLDSF